MPPPPLFTVVFDEAVFLADGTLDLLVGRPFYVDVDSLRGHIQIDTDDSPWWNKAQ
jgi:hypothetical protein